MPTTDRERANPRDSRANEDLSEQKTPGIKIIKNDSESTGSGDKA